MLASYLLQVTYAVFNFGKVIADIYVLKIVAQEMTPMSSNMRFGIWMDTRMESGWQVVFASALVLAFTAGCSSKNYVRSQTTPIIQQTNELDAKTAADHRNITDTDERAQKGISGAQSAADTADQHAVAAGQSADAAGHSAQEAYNRVDSLSGGIASLDNYKPISDVSVTFGFDKSVLTTADRKQLDDFPETLTNARSYILEVTGGADSVGARHYKFVTNKRKPYASVNYLYSAHNIAPPSA